MQIVADLTSKGGEVVELAPLFGPHDVNAHRLVAQVMVLPLQMRVEPCQSFLQARPHAAEMSMMPRANRQVRLFPCSV